MPTPRAGRDGGRLLLAAYRRLRARYGHAGWWPAETPFEVCVGAILTQNTSWRNVEHALGTLRAHGRLSFRGLRALTPRQLAPLLRSSGCYRVKAARLLAFVHFLEREYGGRVERMAGEDPRALRAKLLGVHGIGRETADCIALYAAGQPLFVVDAYTRRVFARLGFIGGDEPYDEVQGLFMARLPARPELFNDFHAQVVRLGKEHCRVRPLCAGCAVAGLCRRVGVKEG